MRFERFDLNLLVSLDALLTELSVTRAAGKLFLSQSAMSYTLARLREYFGDPLLVSTGRTMVLTPFGHRLVEPVRQSLGQMRNLLALRPIMAIENVKRHVHLVSSDHITLTLLVNVFREAAEAAPGLSLELHSVADFTEDMLDNGKIDLLIGARSVINPRHPSEPLVDDRFVALVSADNPDIGDMITLEDYLGADHVTTRWNAGRIVTIDQSELIRRGIERHDTVVVPDFNLVAGFVAGTGRIATLPRLLAQLLVRQWPVRIAEIAADFPAIEIRMQWHRLNDDDPVISWLRTCLRSAKTAWETQDDGESS